mgnify:CR=1 FL=1
MSGFLFVGLGGAVGAMLRYAISLIPYRGSFPILTVVTTGVCGGFTTFSTFSLEAYTLSMDGKYTQAGLYAVLSVGLCLFGIFVGMYLSKAIR